jgi:hypothetical protein
MRTPMKIAILALAMLLVAVVASVATAITFSSTASGGAVTKVTSVRSTFVQTFTDDGGATTAMDLAGGSTTVTVPSGQKALLLVRFSAATACYGGITSGSDSCYVQALIDGVPAPPGEVSFDNNNTNTESTQYEAHAMEWSKSVGAGSHTIQIQVRVDDSPCCVVELDLNPWTLTVERVAR